MSLTKEIVIDQITVTEKGIVLYREATLVIEDGVEISKTYHRSSIEPGADISGHPASVVAVCTAAWTPELMAAKTAEVVSQAQAETATREAAKAAAEQAKLDAEQAEADAKAAQAAAKAAADAAEAENARVKAAQAEAAQLEAAARQKAEFDAAVAAKVAELAP